MDSGEAKRLKQFEEENRKLKHVEAELTLAAAFEGRALKKLVKPAGRRDAASYMMSEYSMSERHACRLIELARSAKRYRLLTGRAGIRSCGSGCENWRRSGCLWAKLHPT